MAAVVKMREQNEQRLVRLLKDAERPMTEREISAMKRLTVSTRIQTREDDIDGVVSFGSK